MELYCGIGRLVSGKGEKGATVAAAEYLQAAYPDAAGFSPRNVRRMRDFYQAYESTPEVLDEAMAIGWTQNTVFLETELTVQERTWYIRSARQYGWSKLELQEKINAKAHLQNPLDTEAGPCYTVEDNVDTESAANDEADFCLPREHLPQSDGRVCDEGSGEKSQTGKRVSHRVR